jgi:ketosteroid isomerase-like protein
MAVNESFQQAAERIYRDWSEALSKDDVEALLALYAPDAVLESPVVPLVLGTESGVCRGRDELRVLLERVAPRRPPLCTHYHTGFLTDGKRTMTFEYPRETPDGEQMEFVEVMEIADGLIQSHRAYWGWRGVKVIQDDGYHK